MSLRKKFPTDRSPAEKVARMLRVDQAGEAGAVRIYQAQMAVLEHTEARSTIAHMQAQEQEHLNAFNELIRQRRVRPTILAPIWHALAYGMGWATARISPEAAMACTVAVESVINDHYHAQEEELKDHPEEKDLYDLIHRCRLEELEHHDIGLQQGAAQAPAYRFLTATIRCCTKIAISLSKRF